MSPSAARRPGGDSAGLPWHGRTLPSTGFDDDAGQADPALRRAVQERADDRTLMDAVAAARLLVPVVAQPTVVEHSTDGPVERQTDLACVTLVAPNGERALPVFTGLQALTRWDPAARPVPVTAARAAQAAVAERCDVLVLDVGSACTVTLRPSMVWALAQRREWLPAHEDPFVARGLGAALAQEPAVRRHHLRRGQPAGVLRVELVLEPGLSAGDIQALATRVGERVATDGELRARMDGLAFTVTS